MVAVVDSGGANLRSVFNALTRLGVSSRLTQTPGELAEAERIILPGVGSALKCRQRLVDLDLLEPLLETTKPILGICIGLQLQFKFLEEGPCEGLGLHEETVSGLPESRDFPVPHMGWNRIRVLRQDPLLEGLDGEYFFFTHSYAAPLGSGTLAKTSYSRDFASVVRKHNWWGVQFHPEKSAAAGRRLLANFMEIQL